MTDFSEFLVVCWAIWINPDHHSLWARNSVNYTILVDNFILFRDIFYITQSSTANTYFLNFILSSFATVIPTKPNSSQSWQNKPRTFIILPRQPYSCHFTLNDCPTPIRGVTRLTCVLGIKLPSANTLVGQNCYENM